MDNLGVSKLAKKVALINNFPLIMVMPPALPLAHSGTVSLLRLPAVNAPCRGR
jgi:hypothetical protein